MIENVHRWEAGEGSRPCHSTTGFVFLSLYWLICQYSLCMHPQSSRGQEKLRQKRQKKVRKEREKSSILIFSKLPHEYIIVNKCMLVNLFVLLIQLVHTQCLQIIIYI